MKPSPSVVESGIFSRHGTPEHGKTISSHLVSKNGIRPAPNRGSGSDKHLGADEAAAPQGAFLRRLLSQSLILAEDWESLPGPTRLRLEVTAEFDVLLRELVQLGLLTEYQRDRLAAGRAFGLRLGNYRVLDRLGAGGMGVVFRGEHIDLRRQVAIKVTCLSPEQTRLEWRFLNEMRVVAQLQHPNIVVAFDAGMLAGCSEDEPGLRYFVMELVPGHDLEDLVKEFGPLSIAEACDRIYQIASALGEAHKHQLVHRDIKPSNIRVTNEGQAKLLDFGLARSRLSRLTEPGMLLGTLDYMAPEQARDAGSVDIRADIFSLGATLYWCLTGRAPYEESDDLFQQLQARETQAPRSVKMYRADIGDELEAVVNRMMACRAEDRYATPQAVMEALLPFLRPELREHRRNVDATGGDLGAMRSSTTVMIASPAVKAARVLIVDDEDCIQQFCKLALATEGVECDTASNGRQGLEMVRLRPYDLVILDIDMPEMSGIEVLKALRAEPPSPYLKVIMLSGRMSPDELSRLLLAGADDFLAKPLSMIQFVSRLKAALKLKDAQDRGDALSRNLVTLNKELERSLDVKDSDWIVSRNALVLALAQLVEARDTESAEHLKRLSAYSRCLATEASRLPAFAGQIDANFIELLDCCAPLHDIGKVGLADHILLKPGKLDADERLIMQTHTVLGAETLHRVAKQHGGAVGFLHMAADIARHHHEWFDGNGYPDRLAGNAIPLSARIVSIGDVYDALRSKRPYKPALAHSTSVQIMKSFAQNQFDPTLFSVFIQVAPQFERIFHELAD
jgi:response regulator RpfG family c-di-GMP phosphodiesterase